jgi:Adenylate cyclase regulatory domain
LARVDPDQPSHCRADAESVLPAGALADSGIDPDQVVLIVRLLMEGLVHAAVAMRQAALQALLRPGASELQLAQALEALARETEPLIDPMISRLARWRTLKAITGSAATRCDVPIRAWASLVSRLAPFAPSSLARPQCR